MKRAATTGNASRRRRTVAGLAVTQRPERNSALGEDTRRVCEHDKKTIHDRATVLCVRWRARARGVRGGAVRHGRHKLEPHGIRELGEELRRPVTSTARK